MMLYALLWKQKKRAMAPGEMEELLIRREWLESWISEKQNQSPPEAVKAETAKPEITKAETAKAETAKPEAAKPETAKPKVAIKEGTLQIMIEEEEAKEEVRPS